MGEKKSKEDMLIDSKGKSSIFTKLYIVVLLIVVVSEFIGIKKIAVGPGQIVLLPMLYAVIIGLILTPDILGKSVKSIKSLISDEVMELAGTMVMFALLPLGVKYGTLVGPSIVNVVQAGPAFLLQELGNVATVLVGLPLALALGLKREAVGATVSICREPTLGVIGERYGINSPEGTGVLGTYMMGTIFGTIFFGLLGSFAVGTGIHPYALAMASGMGSGSMMTAASSSLAETVPAMKDTILAYAATSNMLTSVTGLYSVVFIALPLSNWLYKKLEPKFGTNKKSERSVNDAK